MIRPFPVACGLCVVFAAGHMVGFLQARHAARHDPGLAELTRAMRAHVSPLLGFRPSILDFREFFSAVFSPMLLAVVVLSWVAVGLAADRGAAVRAVSTVDATLMGLLLVVSLVYGVAQGVASCSLIGLVFAIAAWRGA